MIWEDQFLALAKAIDADWKHQNVIETAKKIMDALAAAGYEIKPKQPDHEELREKIAEANAAATWGEPLEQLDEHERDGCFVHADRILALLPDMGNPISEQNQALAGPVMPETPSNAVFPLLRQWLCEDEDWHDGSRMAFWAELRDALMKEQAGE